MTDAGKSGFALVKRALGYRTMPIIVSIVVWLHDANRSQYSCACWWIGDMLRQIPDRCWKKAELAQPRGIWDKITLAL